jgi:ribonuclease HII
LDPGFVIEGLVDSKKISAKKREGLTLIIKEHAKAWAIASASVAEIDQLNILQASLLAMKRAVESLSVIPDWVQVDGVHCPQLNYPVRAIIKGDSLIAEISAASILAKTARDAEMLALHQRFPVYGFDRHKGYPTRQHIAALESHGISIVHRRSFSPVKKLC